MDVPYCIVKGKARLGQVVHKKTATVLAFTDVKKEDQTSFNKLTESIRNNFNERADTVRDCLLFLLLPFLSLFAVVVRHVDAFRGTMLGVVEVLHLLVFVLCLPYFLTLFFYPPCILSSSSFLANSSERLGVEVLWDPRPSTRSPCTKRTDFESSPHEKANKCFAFFTNTSIPCLEQPPFKLVVVLLVFVG